MNKKPHKLLDHPILGYFLLFLFAQICVSLGSRIDDAVSPYIPGYGQEITMVAAIAGGVLALRLIDKRYYPEINELWDRKWNRERPSAPETA